MLKAINEAIATGKEPRFIGETDRNFSSSRRLKEQEDDGVVATVLFPNTTPPFAPPAASPFEAPPYSDDFEKRWAGLRAHNRWLWI